MKSKCRALLGCLMCTAILPAGAVTDELVPRWPAMAVTTGGAPMKYTATTYLPYTQAKRALVLSSGCNLHIWDTDYFRLIDVNTS